MKPIRLTALALTSLLALAAVAPAMAGDHGRGHDRYEHGRGDRGYDRHDDRRDRYERHDRYDRRDAYRAGYYEGRRDGYRDDRHYRPAVVYRPAPVVRYSTAPGEEAQAGQSGVVYAAVLTPRDNLLKQKRSGRIQP